jgi:hypothetical protein
MTQRLTKEQLEARGLVLASMVNQEATIAAKDAEIARLRADLKATETALWQFADDRNWIDQIGCLQWLGKRHAIAYARDVVEGLSTSMDALGSPAPDPAEPYVLRDMSESNEADEDWLASHALDGDDVKALRNKPAPDPAEAMRAALETMVYEATHLSPMEDDGSHKCRISKGALAKARAALKGNGEGK